MNSFLQWGYLSKKRIKELVHRQNIVSSIYVQSLSFINFDRCKQADADEESENTTSLLCHALKRGLWWDGQMKITNETNNVEGPIQKLCVRSFKLGVIWR